MKNKYIIAACIGIGVGLLAAVWPVQSSPYDTGTRVRFGSEGALIGDSNAVRNATDYVCSAVYRCTFPPDVSCVLSDPNVGGPVSWPADLVRMGLIMEAADANLRFAMNATATATSPLWPLGGLSSLPIRMKDANSLRFINLGPTTQPGLLIISTPR